MTKNCGIYCIEVIGGNPLRFGQKYVGQTHNIKDRRSDHFRKLGKNNHENNQLQRYYNKYGPNSLKFVFLHDYESEKLDFYEKLWIKCFDSYKNGFNGNEGGHTNKLFSRTPPKKLKNMITDEIVSVSLISEFSLKYNLSAHCIRSVLRGSKKYHEDWYCPENGWSPREYMVYNSKDIKYRVIETKIKDFCFDHGIENYAGFISMLTGVNQTCNGWYINKKEIIKTPYKLISPHGQLCCGEDLKIFCKENNFEVSGIRNLLRKEYKSYHGWKAYDENAIPEPMRRIQKFVNPLNEIVITDSVTKLARKENLNKFCLRDVLNGRQKTHRGWKKYIGD